MMKTTEINKEAIAEFLATCGPDTRIYLGTDSRRFRNKGLWYATYCSVVVVHVNGSNGAKIFGRTETERLYDNTPDKPAFRLINEAYKVVALHQEIGEVFDGFSVEVHLDLNTSKRYKSNSVVSQAIGYIRGVLFIEPKLKPQAWAASIAADRYTQLRVAA